MKKIILLSLVMVLLAANVWADEFSFRGSKWGMSKEQVKGIEKGKITGEEKWHLIFDVDNVFDMKAQTIYFFTNNNELALAGYYFSPKHTAPSLFLEDYNKIKSSISDKYGKPVYDEEDWGGSLTKEVFSQDKGTALTTGILKFQTKWDMGDVDITMNMDADHFKVKIVVGYESKAYSDVIQAETEARQKAAADEIF